jgi:DNA invertase Pin-like site-specific DNA recombinase
LADTTTPRSKLMLTVLGALAEFERTLIRARTQRVVSAKRALAVGIRFSRKPKRTQYQRQEAQERLEAGES